MRLPTVTVKNPSGGTMTINESDFDPEIHEEATSDVSASPAAAALAEEEGIDLASVAGTGKDGNITKGDVEAAIEKASE